MSALRHSPLIQDLRARLLCAGKPKMLIVGAATRKLLNIAFGVLKSGKALDPAVCMAVSPAEKGQKKEPELAPAA